MKEEDRLFQSREFLRLLLRESVEGKSELLQCTKLLVELHQQVLRVRIELSLFVVSQLPLSK